jgi:hypothetical protein
VTAVKPYPEGHSYEEDEKIVLDLFKGRWAGWRPSRGGGSSNRREYLTGEDERAAMEALTRLLLHTAGQIAGMTPAQPASGVSPQPKWLVTLALTFGGSMYRHFVFKNRRGSPPGSGESDVEVALHVIARERKGAKHKDAVTSAMKVFGLSASAVEKALHRFKSSSSPLPDDWPGE